MASRQYAGITRGHDRGWHSHFCTASLTVLLALFAVTAAPGQDLLEAGESPISPELVQKRLEEVQASGLEDPIKSQALKLYRRVLANLEAAQSDHDAAARYDLARERAPAEAERMRKDVEAKLAATAPIRLGVDEHTPAREIDLRYQQEQANEAAVKAKLAEIEQKLQAETKRPAEVRKRLVAASEASTRRAQELTRPPAPDESPLLREARRWLLQSKAEALSAEITRLDRELLSQPVRIELLDAQRYETATNLARISERVAALKTALSERRRSETEQIIAKLDDESLGDAASAQRVRDLIERNRTLANELAELTSKLELITTQDEATREQVDDIQSRHENARQKLALAGVEQEFAWILVAEHRELAGMTADREASRQLREQIAEAEQHDAWLNGELKEVVDRQQSVNTLLEGLAKSEQKGIRRALERLINGRRELLQQTIELHGEYLRTLATLEFDRSRLRTAVTDYRAFLSERLLWVRSKNPVGLDSITALPAEIARLFAPTNGRDVVRTFLYELTHSPLQMLAILFLLLVRWRFAALRSALTATATAVGRPSLDSLRSTFKALGITLLMVVPWPAFVAITGYRLSDSSVGGTAAAALGTALLRISPAVFFLSVFFAICMEQGIAEKHFRLSSAGLAALRREMRILHVSFLLPALIAVINFRLYPDDSKGSLGQFLSVVLALGLAFFLLRLFSLKNGIALVLRSDADEQPGTLWRVVRLAIGISIPLAVAVTASAGFMYSAVTLIDKLISTMWLVFGAVFVHEMIFRWLLVVHRRLRLAEAIKRREAAHAAYASANAGEPAASEQTDELAEEPEVDFVALDTHTRKLVNLLLMLVSAVATFWIWSSVLPAFGYFNEITLWYHDAVVDGIERPVPITLADLGLGLLIAIVTVISTRTTPSALQIILRQWPAITPGSRLAFATLTRYGIAVTGTIWALNTVGASWAKLQWLVAALSVGIGFGLQEIVANFISGLIILIERPVRVGDVVTVGDATGKVTRLQIRATTLRNFDLQELLVPNKEFITGRVLNWSLSDENIRLFFRVGVAYGSDVARALALMLEAIKEHPLTLEDPAPLVTYEEFGDNALILGLRCYIPVLNKRLETTTDLHFAIERKFRAAGIVIAYPQRDIHLDASRPLDIRLSRAPREPGAEPI